MVLCCLLHDFVVVETMIKIRKCLNGTARKAHPLREQGVRYASLPVDITAAPMMIIMYGTPIWVRAWEEMLSELQLFRQVLVLQLRRGSETDDRPKHGP